MPSPPGSLRQAWYRWKSLKLPWRRKWLCGFDLAGNTFWEFKDQSNAQRFRRIVKFRRHIHYGDVKISPQWLQWLRHTREEAPTLAEQEYDVTRQRQMKLLAAAADERWASKPSALDSQATPQPLPTGETQPEGGFPQNTVAESERKVGGATGPSEDIRRPADRKESNRGRSKEKGKDSPWKVQQGNPGDDWQPATWTPSSTSRRT